VTPALALIVLMFVLQVGHPAGSARLWEAGLTPRSRQMAVLGVVVPSEGDFRIPAATDVYADNSTTSLVPLLQVRHHCERTRSAETTHAATVKPPGARAGRERGAPARTVPGRPLVRCNCIAGVSQTILLC
jgi:hypothetical protein